VTIQDAYTSWATTYDEDRNLTRDLDQRVTQQTLGHLHCPTILEIGCGTGKNTGLLAQIGERVLALDFSPGMIERAKTKTQTEHIAFAVADITKPWPCAGRSVNLIACNLVLEHVRELSFIFREASRALADGGLFFISELHPFRQYLGTKANFQREQTPIEIDAFVHHVSDFITSAGEQGLSLKLFNEWWHEEDRDKPPRLVTFIFEKSA
jgi:malonyl-CoA O-methyltransferase